MSRNPPNVAAQKKRKFSPTPDERRNARDGILKRNVNSVRSASGRSEEMWKKRRAREHSPAPFTDFREEHPMGGEHAQKETPLFFQTQIQAARTSKF